MLSKLVVESLFSLDGCGYVIRVGYDIMLLQCTLLFSSFVFYALYFVFCLMNFRYWTIKKRKGRKKVFKDLNSRLALT